jgi:putative toxin-antitoxin system antitoxin component (TIGR02293 family)
MVDADRVAEVMGVRAKTLGDLAQAIDRGLPKTALTRTARRVSPAPGAARKLMAAVVPEATFKRRTRLTPHEGERTERLARVIATAEYVWDDPAAAHEWLKTRHPMLDGRTPLEAARSELGARRVESVLDAIFHGFPA